MSRWLGVDVGARARGSTSRSSTSAGSRLWPGASVPRRWRRSFYGWIGPRATQSRADWTRHGLGTLGLAGVPDQTNQDQRDAISAAVTARQFSRGLTETIGEIVVPR
ncbi:MAG: hypothetical protein WAL63_06295 [Solirubrobacteraceae bacterium]